ncbi:hypothetical protein NBRC111452_2254 [Companilactobacillus farciminis]|nr:hypothetical protein NBRC111452_2254 [Companilactobacillus farciminis]
MYSITTELTVITGIQKNNVALWLRYSSVNFIYFLKIILYFISATISISIKASIGNLDISMAVLAG